MGVEGRAERAADSEDHANAASIYIGLAGEAVGTERDRLTLLAVEQWLMADDMSRARNAFNTLSKPAAGENSWLWSANRAAFALHENDADAALEIIEPLSREPLPLEHRLRVEALRAEAWFLKGDPARAVELLVQRESWLTRKRDRERNEQRLWRGLLASNPQNLRTAADVASNPEIRGWLTLGSLAASTGQQGMGWSNGVQRWQSAYRHIRATRSSTILKFRPGERLTTRARLPCCYPCQARPPAQARPSRMASSALTSRLPAVSTTGSPFASTT